MNQSESINELATALCEAVKTMAAVQHDKRSNGPAKNRYATLDAIMEAVRPQLGAHGITLQQGLGGEGGEVALTTQLTHSSGQWMRTTIAVPVEDQRGCSKVQALGIHVTYLRRYSVLAMLGLSTTEDDRSAPGHDDDNDGVMPPPEGRGKPVHDASFTADARKHFCARLGEAGLTYEAVAAYCTKLKRARPSGMTKDQRAKLLAHVTADPSVVVP